ncbi:MAG: hypothetical protein IPH57_18760 [Saprospiraceae bacterium]|nr:hypothetical protein [Saprospiraceae bacterium]
MKKNKSILLSFSILFLVLLACNQREELNSIDVITRVGKYRIILPENIGFVFESLELDYKNTFSRIIWIDSTNSDNSLHCAPIYQGTRLGKAGEKRDISDGFLFGDTPEWGKHPVLNKEIIEHKYYDFVTCSFINFPNTTDTRNDYTIKVLVVLLNYVFNDINFSFTIGKFEGSKSYWEILKDIELIKKIQVIKIAP